MEFLVCGTVGRGDLGGQTSFISGVEGALRFGEEVLDAAGEVCFEPGPLDVCGRWAGDRRGCDRIPGEGGTLRRES